MPSRKRYVAKDGTRVPTEHQEQAELFRWVYAHRERIPALKNLFAIPNQGAARLKNLQTEGTMKGVPDMFLAYARVSALGPFVHGLFIELKRVKGGKVSAEQLDWAARLQIAGYETDICRGAEEAWKTILDYLGETDPR